MAWRRATLGALAALALAAPAGANGFAGFFASATPSPAGGGVRHASLQAGGGLARPPLAANPSLAPSAAMLSAIPGLGEVSADLEVGADTLVPALGDTAIPRAGGTRLASGGSGRTDRAPAVSGPDASVCISAIRAAEAAHGIPENLLMAIGLQEAGRKKDGQLTIWPWSVNSHGKTSMFDSKADAIRFVESEKAAGKTLIDVGCMQVNQRWHPEAYASLEEAFDPQASAEYAAKFLAGLHRDSGDWMTAAGNYHSFTPVHHNRYVAGIRRNLEVALAMSSDFDRLAAAAPAGGQNIAALTAPGIAPAPAIGQNAGRSLAGGRGYQRVAMSLPQAVPAAAPVTPRPPSPPLTGAWWSADGGEGPARSIYSRQDLQPVIPALEGSAPETGALQGD